MQTQLDNKLISSFLLKVDNEVLNRGQAFINTTGFFYPVSGGFGSISVFASPYKQLISDVSITGAAQLSGVYVNGVFSVPGQNGIKSIDINQGQVFYTGSGAPIISGSFAVKDVNVYLTSQQEEQIYFETKLFVKPKVPQTITGLSQASETLPAIYIKTLRTESIPFCLGNVNNNEMLLRAVVLTDSKFLCDAVCNILKNMAHTRFKIIEPSGLALDEYGGYTGVPYNYTGLAAQSTQESLIWDVKVSTLSNIRELNKMNPGIYLAFADFTTWTILG